MSERGLRRFHQAQAGRGAGYEAALGELRRGRKRGHWIWWVLPQIAGLGRSSTSIEYAIADRAEAEEYLRDPVLAQRYAAVVEVIAEALAAGARLDTLMGDSLDAMKAVSSMTLFASIAGPLAREEGALACLSTSVDRALGLATAQGFPRCRFTLDRLAREVGGRDRKSDAR